MENLALGDDVNGSPTPEFGGKTTLQPSWEDLSGSILGEQSDWTSPENARI